MIKTFEVTELPVRCATFVERKHWLITGSVSDLNTFKLAELPPSPPSLPLLRFHWQLRTLSATRCVPIRVQIVECFVSLLSFETAMRELGCHW